jgi:hypothetical protein
MTIKASGYSAILAAGLLVGLAGLSQAATGAAATANSQSEAAAAAGKHARHSSHRAKKYAHRKSLKVALKSNSDNKAGAADDDDDNSLGASAIPPSVANANAQLASADTPAGSARAMSARANEILQAPPLAAQPAADAQVVSPDQINDLDRALPDSTHPAPAVKMASAEAPAPAPPAPPAVAAGSDESSSWDETSLIGKIFIGFGALLTMASAARMFMA